MNQKTFKILAAIILFIGIVGVWFIVTRSRIQESLPSQDNTIEDPFGIGGAEGTTLNNGGSLSGEGDSGVSDGSQDIKLVDVTIIEDNPRLKQLFSDSVSGAVLITEQRDVEVQEEISDDVIEGYDFSGYPTLKFGDDRLEVADLKTVLNRQDPSPSLSVDTAFDTDLKNAVISFQTKNNLTPDGIVGRGTYRKLNEFQGLDASNIDSPVQSNKETVDIVRYMARSSGLIFDQAVRKIEPAKKITVNPIPKVREAFFDSTGEKVVARYLNNNSIETSVLSIFYPTLENQEEGRELLGELRGDFLPLDISFVSVSPDKKKFFYLIPTNSGSNGFIYNFSNGSSGPVISSTFSEWLPQWDSDKSVNLTTKASSSSEGFTYKMNTDNGSLDRVVGGVMGLTSRLSPDGKKAVYSSVEDGRVSTYVRDISGGVDVQISPSTLSEKCIWTKDSLYLYCAGQTSEVYGNLPDNWYQGKVSFQDVLWKYDVEEGNSNIIYNIVSKGGPKMDIVDLQLNEKEDYLIFKNNIDQTLWGLDLRQ